MAPTGSYSEMVITPPSNKIKRAQLFLYGVLSVIALFVHSSLLAGDTLQLIKRIPIKGRIFTTDPTGNVYIVRDFNELIKLNPSGDSIGQFSEVRKGRITQIDASNPLRVLLYNAEYSQIVVLDNLLSLKNQIRLSDLGVFNAPVIANSADADIWVWDPTTAMLLKIDEKPRIQASTPLRMMLEFPPAPIYMVEQDRNLFMVDSTDGILRFDQFGFFKTRYPYPCKEVQFMNHQLIYFKDGVLNVYNTRSFTEKTLSIPSPETCLQVRVERERLYILRADCLEIYSLEESSR